MVKDLHQKQIRLALHQLEKKGEVIHHMGITKTSDSEQYIGSLFTGTMSVIANPSITTLANYTKQCTKIPLTQLPN